MITARIDGQVYELPSMSDALASLTGQESLLVEEYLGGFDQLGKQLTKSAVVMVWLVLRSAGQPRTFDEILAMPGITFGNVIETSSEGEPEDPMKDPGRPLASSNGSNGSTVGSDGSAATPAISGSSGAQD